ncbi:MAG: hypothetical protein FJ044_05560 [Candidatus Cloacimonetes bacterium]|nr:hypothetical protein [Candidatus Cloacimonadota bacterium]
MKEEERVEIVSNLAGVFKGGRISGWVIRNRGALESGNWEDVELDRLLVLSPSFAERTAGLTSLEKMDLIVKALALADESYLSATRLVV